MKKPATDDAPPLRGSWVRPLRLSNYSGPTSLSEHEVSIYATMSVADFELVSDGWHRRLLGRVRAARAALSGGPQARAKEARIKLDHAQSKPGKAQSKHDRALATFGEALKAFHVAKEELAAATKAA